jgi:hypothetical protein
MCLRRLITRATEWGHRTPMEHSHRRSARWQLGKPVRSRN